MFIHDIAKWIIKYDYTSKITAALNARDLREQHDAHEHLYTPDTLNTGMRIKSRTDSNHHCCRHRYHRGTSLIFPNAERNRRGSKSPFNDRAPRSSIRSDPRPFTTAVSILNYARRGSAIITAFVASARNADVWLRRIQRLSRRETATIMWLNRYLHAVPEYGHACTCTELSVSSRYWQLGHAARWVLRASRETEKRNARGAAPFVSSFGANALSLTCLHFARARGYNVTIQFNWTISGETLADKLNYIVSA